MGTPRTLSALIVLATVLCIGNAFAARGLVLIDGADYFSVQVATGAREKLLQEWREFKDQPFARVDVRDGHYALRVGFWKVREDAEQTLARIRLRYPGAFVRIAPYKPQSIVQRWESPEAEVRAPAAARGKSEGVDVSPMQEKPPANVLYRVEREATAAREAAQEGSPSSTASKPAVVPAPAGGTATIHEKVSALAPTMQTRKPIPSTAAEPESSEETLRRRIADAVALGDGATLTALARKHPKAFGCDRVDWAWAAADALATQRDSARALAIARRLIADCAGEEDRLATLYMAKPWVAERDWNALLVLEAGRPRSAEGQAHYRKLVYEHRLARWQDALERKAPEAAQLLEKLAPAIVANRDGGAALLAGWQYHEAGMLDAAAAWFRRALAWGANAADARRGLALAALGSGRLEEALEHARALPPGDAGRASLIGDVFVALRRQIGDAVARREAAALAQLASAHPKEFGCDRIDWTWAAAEALVAQGDIPLALAITRRLITDCPGENDRMATLHKAKPWLGERDWDALLELEAGRLRSTEGQAHYRKLVYEHRLARWQDARERKAPEAAQLFEELAPAIEANRDGKTALLAGWRHHEAGMLDAAAAWFRRALAWGANVADARRGLALAAFGSHRLDEALEHARALPPDDSARASLLGDIFVAQAMAEFQASRHARTLELLKEASGHAPLPRHARTARAWSLLKTADADKAATAFAELYREHPDEETASGVLASHRGTDRAQAIGALAQTEPLRTRWRREGGREAFAAKRFLAAASLDPERYAGLGTSASGAFDAGVGVRARSGSEGLSRLRLRHEPSAGFAYAAGERQELRFRVDAVDLSSGVLPANSCVGSACSGTYAFAPVTRAHGLQPRLSWRDERDQVWEAEIGLTPDGGAVSPHPFGRLVREVGLGWGTVTGTVYAAPVKDSILSYVGLRDPYGGGTWGRVLRYGAEIGALRVAEAPWSVGASLRAEHLAGTRVTGNDRLAFTGSLGRDLRLAGFEYAVLGMGLALDRYERNLSGFALGEGGYFSPQRYARAGPALDFLTEEGRRWIVRGRLSAGWASKREGAIRSHGTEASAEVAFAWNLSPSLQASVFWNRSSAPQFSETIVGAGLRVYLDARRGVLSADLPRASDLR